MKQTQEFNHALYNDYYIVHCSNTKLLPLYQTMYFFKVRKQKEYHQEIGSAYMLACPCDQFTKVCDELLRASEGHVLLKVKWALRYWWYKRVAQVNTGE